MATRFRIGTRPSRLARVQAELVRKQLEAVLPGLAVELVPITTSGDRNRSPSLAQAGGKGLFVKELEQALREHRIDVCVHSIKDLPAKLAGDFRLAAVPAREDPRDAIVTREAGGLSALRKGARIGTSSARRKFQALRLRPDLEIVALRGNVDTRLGKVARGDLDGIIVAAAGLNRLGRPGELRVTELDDRDFIPAGGQGALAVEALVATPLCGSQELEHALDTIDDLRARIEVGTERAFLATIGASCASPIGVKATLEDQKASLRARVFSLDGSKELTDEMEDRLDPAHPFAPALGVRLAERMIERGAHELIGGAAS